MINVKLLFLAITLIASYTLTAQFAINTDGSNANGSAILDVKSTEKGFLPPRMTGAERIAINTPVAGLVIWCTNCGPNGELQVFNGSSWTNMIGGTAASTPPVIGDYYLGGVVFYLDGSGGGLVCAIRDQTSSSGISWWNGSHIYTDASGTAIGTGQANTTAIIAIQGDGTYAATVCTALGGGWFLPSKNEIHEMYNNKAAIDGTALVNGGTAFASDYYWSSTEWQINGAWMQNFGNSNLTYAIKSSKRRVRAVRAF